jgi:hypothetical protein
MVSWTWSADFSGLDACRAIDSKLRLLARALNSWRAASVGSIRLQLVAARVVIYGLDRAQESWQLSPEEIQWRRELKGNTIGLASLERTMARQRARTRHLREGDAGTKYFHLMACHRRRKNYLFAIQHDGQTFSEEHAKSEVVFSYYNGILGAPSYATIASTWHCSTFRASTFRSSPNPSPTRRSRASCGSHRLIGPRAPTGLLGAFFKAA